MWEEDLYCCPCIDSHDPAERGGQSTIKDLGKDDHVRSTTVEAKFVSLQML